eukprot:TRINITY_DN2427_c0_g1_i1.p1 TRINITY_DN2427_c0_g1~~TRINITY_DN2427_c0_g1_i1.p1  ORF type:complete len:349 (-),score=51.06 TRINITY_DN2427_c0_g1_i1:213-1259(-)
MGCVGTKAKGDFRDEATAPPIPNGNSNKSNEAQKELKTNSPAAVSQPESKSSQTKAHEEEEPFLQGIKDHYQFESEITRGGYSVVYLGKSKKDGNRYAVRQIKKEALDDEEAINALRREISILRSVDHPNILKLYEVYEDDESYYLVLEHLTGKPVYDRIMERSAYTEKDVSNFIKQLLQAVAYLHSRGIAHRDLKPQNLLSSGDPEVIKVVDFGFSKNFAEDKMVTSVGSPSYVAPEVLSADSFDMSVDMWSVGVILYVLLCGFTPFQGPTPQDLFKKILAAEYNFDEPAWQNVSDHAKNVVRNLLMKEAKKRWTAETALQDPWVQGQHCAPNSLHTPTNLQNYGTK